MTPESRRRIGKYQMLTRLSTGGMAELFLATAHDVSGARRVCALKRILPAVSRDEGFVRMLIDEARITASLSHPNICRVIDLGVIQGECFLVLEFIAGKDLVAVLREAYRRRLQVPVPVAASIVRDVCLGLHHAHHYVDRMGRPSPVIHRDIAPKNVMVSYQGEVKIIDFGVAKVRGKLEQTTAGMVKGTLEYMSPEQLRGEVLDGRTDLYSAGIVLFELLTSRRAFAFDRDVDLMRAILGGEVPDLVKYNPRLPAPLIAVFRRATSFDRNARYASGEAMARALEGAVDLTAPGASVQAFMQSLFKDSLIRTQALFTRTERSTDPARPAPAPLGGQTPTATLTPVKPVRPADPPTSPGGVPVLNEHEPATVLGRPGFDLDPLSEAPNVQSEEGIASLIAESLDEQGTDMDHPRARVMVVEPKGGSDIQAALEREHYQVIACSTPEQAFEALQQDEVDIILVDVLIPGLNGFELCRRLRDRMARRYIPIMIVSAALSLEERVRALDVGADDFLPRPFDPAELIDKVKSQLQRASRVVSGQTRTMPAGMRHAKLRLNRRLVLELGLLVLLVAFGLNLAVPGPEGSLPLYRAIAGWFKGRH